MFYQIKSVKTCTALLRCQYRLQHLQIMLLEKTVNLS